MTSVVAVCLRAACPSHLTSRCAASVPFGRRWRWPAATRWRGRLSLGCSGGPQARIEEGLLCPLCPTTPLKTPHKSGNTNNTAIYCHFPTPGRGLPYGSGLGLSRCLGPGECLHSFIHTDTIYTIYYTIYMQSVHYHILSNTLYCVNTYTHLYSP